jgi:flagellar hook assembly protein FlgD
VKRVKISCLVLTVILVSIFAQWGTAQSLSGNALIQRKIFADPDVWHLTKGYANSEWGVDLYAYPYSVSQAYFLVGTDLLSAVSVTSDYTFHRVVYSEPYLDWIKAYGSFGSNLGQFNSPSGIVVYNRPNDDLWNYYVYVADTWNNRIIRLVYNWGYEEMTGPSEITGGGLVLPKDLDINNGGQFGNASNDRLWVVNGDNTIKEFDLNGNLLLTYSYPDFNNLRAIACGRSGFVANPPYQMYANNNYFYVIDNTGPHYEIFQFKEYPPGNIQYERSIGNHPPYPAGSINVASLDVDNFGQVWVTFDYYEGLSGDRYSSIVKYTDDLEPLCRFDAGGAFNRLQCFSNADGNRGCGNVIVLEEWDNESGALYYWIGTDILNCTTGSNDEHWCHYAAYTLVDPALLWVIVYNEAGDLVDTVFPPPPVDSMVEFSGWTDHWWDGYDRSGQIAPSGNYRIEVKAASVYKHLGTGQPVNTVIKDGWVYHIDYSAPLNTSVITSVQAMDTSMYIEWDDNNVNELGHIIERKDIISGQWSVIDTTTWDVESYTDYQIIGSETYDYRLRAYNYFGVSGYSNTVSQKARPRPPLNLFVENFYCNRDYRLLSKVSPVTTRPEFNSTKMPNCVPPYPDSIPSDASRIYADYPINQKPGTFAGMEVWSKHCSWYDHNVVRRETTFVNLDRPMPIHTPPDTVYCTGDWTYYFKVRTIDIYGDSSMYWPPGSPNEFYAWIWPYACCVGPCRIFGLGQAMVKMATPTVFSLEQNYPNPFNPETQITYALPLATHVKLVLYNVLGQKVKTLVDEEQTAGYKTMQWDGRDENENELASGIYFYHLQAGDYNEVKKMIMMK